MNTFDKIPPEVVSQRKPAEKERSPTRNTEPIIVVDRKTNFRKLISKHNKSISNVALWLCYSVVFALVPILAILLISFAVQQPFNLELVLGHGVLLGVSIPIMGEAMKYLLTNPNVGNNFKAFFGFASVLVLLSSSILIGILSVASLQVNTTYIMYASFVVFAATLIVGSFCKWTEK